MPPIAACNAATPDPAGPAIAVSVVVMRGEAAGHRPAEQEQHEQHPGGRQRQDDGGRGVRD
ncbi:hypothetical protein ND748_17275, partial [Frankia sp. AiPs1]|uniref:hypothetical protein n=1 Tax=Frankia sp. AiPs1 TaxID=573493 RepID=UPI002043C84C